MVQFRPQTREVITKVVYYGPPLGGKTTNLRTLYDGYPPATRGELVVVPAGGDRTIFFDFLPVDAGTLRGMRMRVQLYTVPGQVHYNATRQVVLRGVDAVVFVADSQRELLRSNRESWENLKENLALQGLSLAEIPHVLQYNKRDLADVLSVDDLDQMLNEFNAPFFEAVSTTGIGVEETLQAVVKLVARSLRDRFKVLGEGSEFPEELPPLQPVPAPAAPRPEPSPQFVFAPPLRPAGAQPPDLSPPPSGAGAVTTSPPPDKHPGADLYPFALPSITPPAVPAPATSVLDALEAPAPAPSIPVPPEVAALAPPTSSPLPLPLPPPAVEEKAFDILEVPPAAPAAPSEPELLVPPFELGPPAAEAATAPAPLDDPFGEPQAASAVAGDDVFELPRPPLEAVEEAPAGEGAGVEAGTPEPEFVVSLSSGEEVAAIAGPGSGSAAQALVQRVVPRLLAQVGEVRELELEVPVPAVWTGGKRLTLQFRLTLIPEDETHAD
jgi:mutual gliding-motility protein MglA